MLFDAFGNAMQMTASGHPTEEILNKMMLAKSFI
jgi:hypothetical protein